MQNKKLENLVVKGVNVSYKRINDEDYICLTDIAKVKNELFPADVIKNWLRTRATLEYLKLWEIFYNPDVKLVEIDQFICESGQNHFVVSPQRWIELANSKGIISKSGKYGGTYDIKI